MEEIIQKLQNVKYTLNQVEVHEESNLERMLGCIRTLREAIGQLQQTKTQTTTQTAGD